MFQVVEITPAPETAAAGIAAYIQDATQQSLLTEFVSGLRDQTGIRVNQQALNQLLALDQTGQ